MVYSQDLLDNTLDNINNITAQVAPGTTGPVVQVLFNGSGVHTVGGPTPFVDISSSVETNPVGIPESTTVKITLTGKIVRPQAANATGSGISHVLSGISALTGLFRPDIYGNFEIKCLSNNSLTDMYSYSGVKVVSVDVNKTNDNWVQTADYSVVLEGAKSLISGFSVKNLVDSWSIEPLEEYTYTSFIIDKISQKSEYHNPNLKPTAPTASSPQPAGNQSGGQGGGVSPNAEGSINVINIPQFKVTHTVSAVGVPSGTGSIHTLMNNTYLNAYAWVSSRLNMVATGGTTSPTGLVANKNTIGTPNYHMATGYFYNHLRTSNFSIMEGRYEVIDNWIAMPTGIGYIEDYTIDMSTDDKYIHNISVKGEVKGLSLGGNFSGSGAAMHLSTGTPSFINGPGTTGYAGTLSHKVPDVTPLTDSAATTISSNKYQNASSGWIYDIKPYLYRRACIAMNTSDRTVGYVPPLAVGGSQPPPNNPVYSKHTLLNIIPISTSESHNTRKGIISYDYTFNNKFTIISGVISENISIEDSGPTDVIGEAFVLGRALGPILQDLGTKTSSKKSISIEVIVVPPSSLKGFFMQNSDCPLWTGGTTYTTITGIIEGLKPFGDRPTSMFGQSTVMRSPATNAPGQVYVSQDNQSWDPSNGRYSKSVTWIYQQCTTAKHWMDH